MIDEKAANKILKNLDRLMKTNTVTGLMKIHNETMKIIRDSPEKTTPMAKDYSKDVRRTIRVATKELRKLLSKAEQNEKRKRND